MKGLLAAICLATAIVAEAEDPRIADLAQSAEALIAEGDYEQAVASLRSALDIAGTVPGADARIETAFALARAYEQWAAADRARRDEHYRNALRTYSKLWIDEPRRSDAAAAARNNCAQIYVTLGNDARAAELFEEAVAVEDPRRAFYLANFADFLVSRGRKNEAITQYERAIKEEPDDRTTEARLLDLYGDGRTARFLWLLVDRNELDRARSLALDQLGRDLAAVVHRELLSIVAVTLARQHVRPNDFASVDARLVKLIGKRSIAKGIGELRRLYAGEMLDATSYSWWRNEVKREPPALTPRLAFSALAWELGEQIRTTAPAKAEQYFMLAIDVSDGLDPDPVISLAKLYDDGGRKEDLRRLSDEIRPKMKKDADLRHGRWRSVYRYHVALGTIFARLGSHGDVSESKMAILHLEDAREIARNFGSGALLDPRSAGLLTRSYAAVESKSAKDLDLQFAWEYLNAGRPASAQLLLGQALQNYREKKDLRGEALTLLMLGIALSSDDADRARANLEEAVTKMEARNDAVGAWMSLLVRSQLENALGNSVQALAAMDQALAVINKAKTSSTPVTLETLLTFSSASATIAGTMEMLESSAELMKPIILQYLMEPITHDLYGSLLTDAGQFDRAEAELNAAAGGSQFLRGAYDFSIAAHFGDLRFRQQRYDEARTHYLKALSGSLQMPGGLMTDRELKVRIYDRLSRLEAVTGHLDEALRFNDRSLEIVRSSPMPLQEYVTLETRGQLLVRGERFAEAEGVFQEALKIAEATKDIARQAAIESHLGSLKFVSGSYGAAVSHLEKSVQLQQSLDDPVSEAAIWGSLFHAYLFTDNLAAAENALSHARELVDERPFEIGRDMIAMYETWLRFRKGQATAEEVTAVVNQFIRNAQLAKIEIAPDLEQILRRAMKTLQ